MTPAMPPRRAVRVAAAALLGLMLLSLAVTRGDTAALDRATLDAFAAWRGPAVDAFFRGVTWLGSGVVLAPATALIQAALAARRQWASARLLGTTYFGASLTTWLLKAAVGRERPQLHAVLDAVTRSDGAFPSGHATHAAAFALGLWLLAARHRPDLRAPAGLALGTAVLMVAASRLHLQVHWPSDVLAGMLVAVFWAGFASALAHKEKRA